MTATRNLKIVLMALIAALMIAAPLCLSEAKATEEKSEPEKVTHFNVYDENDFYEAIDHKGYKVIKIKKNLSIGTTYVNSNTKIIATGKTINCGGGALRNRATKANYGSVKDVEIIGGTWKSAYKRSLFQFVHGNDITMKNMTITCGITGHAIELIACKDVEIKGCKITGVGKCKKTCLEEQIQIDIATPRTAPTVPGKLRKGQTCKDIEIENCTVTGARAICANYASKEKKYKKKFHEDIEIKNCKLIGKTSEALALFNAMKVKVIKNTIKTKSSRKNSPYSIGCHLHIFGKITGVKKANRTAVIKNNKVWGGRQAIQVYSHSSSKYRKVTVTGNKAHCKKGRGNALKIRGASKKVVRGNKTYKW